MGSSGEEASSAAPSAITAAEKRAARRARVLAGSERRLKLLTGEIDSLKPKNEPADDAIERAMDEGVMELLDATELPTDAPAEPEATPTGETKFPPRVDPAQRRRDAQARRQKKEAMVQEILSGTPASTTSAAEQVYADTVADVRKDLGAVASPEKRAESSLIGRHAIALRLRSAEEKGIILAIVGAALYLAFMTDLRNITTDLLLSNPLFLSYQKLVANGVSLDSIRQQMQRENLEPALMDQIERVFVSQRKSESLASGSVVSSLIPNFLDIPGFFASLIAHPPIVLCVLVLRVLVDFLVATVHRVFQLPDVSTPQDDDLGFVANLALASRPALKGYIAKARKSFDDVFLFLWAFVLAVSARAVAAAHTA